MCENEPLDDICGSIHYMAPEVFVSTYNEKIDIWSLGVMIYTLLTKRFPFDDQD